MICREDEPMGLPERGRAEPPLVRRTELDTAEEREALDALERCTRRALVAWREAGRP